MAELVDVLALEASESNLMGVRVSLPAQANCFACAETRKDFRSPMYIGAKTTWLCNSRVSLPALDINAITCYAISMNKTSQKVLIRGLEILVILAFAAITFTAVRAEAYHGQSNGAYYRMYRGVKAPPYVVSIRPSSIGEVREKLTITVSGYGFGSDSIIQKNGLNRPTVFIDQEHLLTDIYPGDALPGQNEFLLAVFNQQTGEHSNAAAFTIGSNTLGKGVQVITGSAASANFTSNNLSVRQSSSSSSGSKASSSNNTSRNTSSTNNSGAGKTVSRNDGTNRSGANADEVNENYSELTASALLGSNDSFWPSGLLQWILAAIMIVLIISLWRYVHRSPEKYFTSPMKHA